MAANRELVDFRNNVRDKVLKASTKYKVRFTHQTLAKLTGHTVHQVGYRMRQLQQYTMDDRRGRTIRAKFILAKLDKMLDECKDLRLRTRRNRVGS